LIEDPAHWAEHYADCGGSEQSPIDLKTSGSSAVKNISVAAFSFANAYSSPVSGKWVNNGHSGLMGLNSFAMKFLNLVKSAKN